MAYVIPTESGVRTAADLVEWFGPIPLHRICFDPPPGSATEEDVIEIHNREDRLFELVDGILVEKTMGTYEAYLATVIALLLGNYVREHKLGIVLGADGMMRLAPQLIRIPDAAFISWDRLPGRRVPRDPVADLAPDLAIEVISKWNTHKEMERKLGDYFAAGVRQVWYAYPTTRDFHVYAAPDRWTVFGEDQTIDGGDLLPGLRLAVREVFAEPGENASS